MKKILIFITLSVIFWGGAFYLPTTPLSQEKIVFTVKRGESSKEIAMKLEKEDLIFWAPIFRSYVFVKGISEKLKAGSYLLSRSMSVSEIAEKLAKGEVMKKKIVIPEGWNLRDIGFYFERKGMFQAEELWELVGFPAIDYSKDINLPKPKDFSLEYDFLRDKPKNVSLEGYLFPDTYEILNGITLEEIVRKMLDNFNKKLTPTLREEIKNQKKSIFEIVTMASLLEKEVKTKEDKEIVSGILWKRLENKIPLQVDATITYITRKKTTRISKEETQIDSPYNTYKYLGLPAGPICNPGLESILAALYPKESEYWYYLSTPEGKTVFSKTLEEHNIAKAKYLR